jgi:hypothetical protein
MRLLADMDWYSCILEDDPIWNRNAVLLSIAINEIDSMKIRIDGQTLLPKMFGIPVFR